MILEMNIVKEVKKLTSKNSIELRNKALQITQVVKKVGKIIRKSIKTYITQYYNKSNLCSFFSFNT